MNLTIIDPISCLDENAQILYKKQSDEESFLFLLAYQFYLETLNFLNNLIMRYDETNKVRPTLLNWKNTFSTSKKNLVDRNHTEVKLEKL